MRIWILILLSVLAIAGSVLYASESQRHTGSINFNEARTAERMQADLLDQNRGLNAYLATGNSSLLRPYFDGGRQLRADLRKAREVSADDEQEIAEINSQASAWRSWQKIADTELRLARSGHRSILHGIQQRSAQIDRFIAANARYDRRLATVRDEEERSAALVPVWIILALSALFLTTGAVLVARSRRHARVREVASTAAREADEQFVRTQGRFAEALQVTENQSEAHELLRTHLERSIPDSNVIVLNRNNSANRLEATVGLDADHPLTGPLDHAQPRSCLAVRLSRRYDRGGDAREVLGCEICGKLPGQSSCRPLLVGGEVIGSVLVGHQADLEEAAQRRVDDSVTQSAPVLANLRNLAIAEMRAATDSLTGLPNKRALDDSLNQLLAQAGRSASPLSLILADLDHFKRINDTHGHERGNEVLAAVGIFLAGEIRTSDVAARMGGEEFAIVCPDTNRSGALHLAEKLRTGLHAVKVGGLERHVTASFGVATFPDDAVDRDVLLRIADRALYAAKQAGRDRVEAASAGPSKREVDPEPATVPGDGASG